MGIDPLAPRAVFLDRDGVLNRAIVVEGRPHPPATVADTEILPGVPAALESLARQGLLLIGVTNQPDVARGQTTRMAVEAINDYLLEHLPLACLLTCYHDDADRCACRKPKPGLLRQAAAERGIALDRSFMVGDRWSDVAAGRAVGCSTFLIAAPYSELRRCTPDYVVDNLTEAAVHIVRLLQREENVGGG
jgi:D-glycero-D-manno-heptose 1,7-bisphosphate phosphatase